MKMKQNFIALMAALLAVSTLWAREDDEVIVTRQLTLSQRNSLPEKTISLEMKRLYPSKRAAPGLLDAIRQVMDTIAQEDYQNRTFVLLLEPKADGEVGIGTRSDDIVTRGRKDASAYLGAIEHQRYHFVVLTGNDNQELLEQTFKRQGKVKFVQEFEFVDFKTPSYPTSVVATWSPDKGLQWLTVIINEDPNADRERQQQTTHIQE